MFEIFMMVGVAFVAIGFSILQFAFLRWLYRQNEFWVLAVAFCTLIGCDCMMLGVCFL